MTVSLVAQEVTAPVEAAPVEAAPVEAESSPAEETVEEITGPGSVEAGINLRVSQGKHDLFFSC